MSLTIEYQLVGTGWAKCTITSGEVNCEVTASYLSDALGNLVLGAVSMLSGITSVSFGFDEEPGEYRWNVHLSGPTEITLSIFSFFGPLGNQPSTEGESIFCVTCPLLEFGKAVQAAAMSVLAVHGLAGYREEWAMHPFPSKALDLLNEYVALSESNLRAPD